MQVSFYIEKSENPCGIVGGFYYVLAYSHVFFFHMFGVLKNSNNYFDFQFRSINGIWWIYWIHQNILALRKRQQCKRRCSLSPYTAFIYVDNSNINNCRNSVYTAITLASLAVSFFFKPASCDSLHHFIRFLEKWVDKLASWKLKNIWQKTQAHNRTVKVLKL